MNSIFFQNNAAANCADGIGQAVQAGLGLSCNFEIPELQQSVRRTMRFQQGPISQRPLHELALLPVRYPLLMPLSPGTGRSFSSVRSTAVEFSVRDLMAVPLPIATERADLGPDVGATLNVPITSGIATWQNKPVLQIPEFTSPPTQASVAWQAAVPLLGWIFRINWTDGDTGSYLSIGRTFTNVPGSFVELARINPDEDCKQASLMAYFYDPCGQVNERGESILRYSWNGWASQGQPGDDFWGDLPSLAPWEFRVIANGAVKTTGYGFTIDANPVPVTKSTIEDLLPIWNGSGFDKPAL